MSSGWMATPSASSWENGPPMLVVTRPPVPKLSSRVPSTSNRARTKAVNVPPASTTFPSGCSAIDERSPPNAVVVALPPVPKAGSRPYGCTRRRRVVVADDQLGRGRRPQRGAAAGLGQGEDDGPVALAELV